MFIKFEEILLILDTPNTQMEAFYKHNKTLWNYYTIQLTLSWDCIDKVYMEII